jgi:hypothetical protein
MQSFSRILNWVGFAAGVLLLGLQFYITVKARLANGDSILGALWFYFTFFTILTNFGVMLTHLAHLRDMKILSWFEKPAIKTMFAGAIFLVMCVYHFVLAGLWQPEGLFAVADIGLHYLTPLVYLAWWAIHKRAAKPQLADVPYMLVPPVIYLIWAMTRGLITNEYPYPFLNLSALGFGATAINIVGLFVGLAVLFSVLITIENRLLK